MPVDLSRSVAVITGGGSGIGLATAQALARRGARVVITDINQDRALQAAAQLGDAAIAARCDVTRADDLAAARDLAIARFGQVDIVMNNVGVLAVGKPEDIPLDAWQRVIDVNLMSVVRSLAVFLPGLLAQGSGHIINTASTAGLFPYGHDRLPYTTTKHAIVGLSESLAVYLRPKGIGVSCFCPAGVITNITEQITTYGAPRRPAAPNFGVIDATTAGELVAEGVATGRFLILTTDDAASELRERGNDIEAYLERVIKDYT
jgi:NAD(P)-dependent dehydrogenase (short-subunit alcohol dehydrogenase family)